MATMQRNVNDSVFVNIFRHKKYLVELYQVLHPEDEVNEDDLELVTIENILAHDMYNDLGFLVKNKLIVLVEAQTTWSTNIIMRMFLYLARTYQDLISKNRDLRVRLYGSKNMELPTPELYVIYTGERGDKSEVLSLKDNVFPGADNIELKAKVIFADKYSRDIVNQYISFCGILKEQMSVCNGDKETAIRETIRICIEHGNLSTYLSAHKKEVEDKMFAMLTQEEINNDRIEIAREEAALEATELTKRDNAKSFIKLGKLSLEEIANGVGLPLEEVQSIAKSINA